MRPVAGWPAARPGTAARRLLRAAGGALLLLAVALAMAGGAACARGAETAETEVSFLRDWQEAKDRAASEGKPIMVNFYTDT